MKKNIKSQRGSVMVEAIAAIALMGLMGTLLYRQVKNRNDELDNINMASEIRAVKDATAAYIQADQAALSANCETIDGHQLSSTEKNDVNSFLPYHWQKDAGGSGITDYFDIWLTCSGMDEDLAPGRNAIYATIVPMAGALPPKMTLKRAARVSNLIGSDGGILIAGDNKLSGTMGAWEVPCSDLGGDLDGLCATFSSDNNDRGSDKVKATFVATTDMDIYIPESDYPDNTVAVPQSIAFKELHSTHYFSVGDESTNCVKDYGKKEVGKFDHEIQADSGSYANDDDITRVGDNDCNPLFWVGSTGPAAGDNSTAGHVYIKKNLYIGRDNANSNQVVAIEAHDSDNTERQIRVYDTDGNARLILNAQGQIVGREESDGSGYRLDPTNGEIILFKEYTIGGEIVQLPTLRLTNNRVETNIQAEYPDSPTPEPYAVDPANTSLMNDIRLISRGGAKLSDILPDYITKGIYSISNSDTIAKPDCPTGYVRAITVTPIQASQEIVGVHLSNLSVSPTPAVVEPIDATIKTESTTTEHQKIADSSNKLVLTQRAPVNITIENNSTSPDSEWDVVLKYGNKAPTTTDPISALVHTYCVYDSENFDLDGTASGSVSSANGGMIKDEGVETERKSQTRVCTTATDCVATELCYEGYCMIRPTCSDADKGKKIGPNLYCTDSGQQVYIECLTDDDCHGTSCDLPTHQCVAVTPAPTP